MRRRKAAPPRFIWKSPRELTVADRGKGAPRPLFLDQTPRNFFETAPLPYLRVEMTGPPLSEGLDLPLIKTVKGSPSFLPLKIVRL